MTLFPLSRRFRAVPAAMLGLLLTLAGCGHGHANARPASALSAQDRTLLDGYEKIRAALAADDLRAARVSANALAQTLKPVDDKAPAPEALAPIISLSNAPALDRARQFFRTLSGKVVPMADGVEGYYVMTCPLPSTGDWIQRDAKVDNPYMGKAMHDFGEVRK